MLSEICRIQVQDHACWISFYTKKKKKLSCDEKFDEDFGLSKMSIQT